MATATPAGMLVTSVICISVPIYFVAHAWTFDRLRCLIPNRKQAVRTGMIWLLGICLSGFTAWAFVLTYLKYKNGWVQLPEPYGMMPVPISAWSAHDQKMYRAGDIMLVLSFSMYDAVNLEEALYWTFLLESMKDSRAPRGSHSNPKRKRITRYLNSNVFLVWIILSLVFTAAHFVVPYATRLSLDEESIRIFIFEGASGVLNVVLSLTLVYYLPGFIKQVAAHGASPDVITKLQFFDEMNRIRTIGRLVFSFALLSVGFSAMTESKSLIMNKFANDLIFMVGVVCLWVGNIISVMLYLPISLSGDPEIDQKIVRRRITQAGADLGPHRRASYQPGTRGHAHGHGHGKGKRTDPLDDPLNQLMSRHSYEHRTLVTLMRERGSIKDGERVPEDDLFDMDRFEDEMDDRQGNNLMNPVETRVGTLHVEEGRREFGANSLTEYGSTRPESIFKRASERSEKSIVGHLPPAIARFNGPFEGVPKQPVVVPDVVIQVSQEVEITRETDDVDEDRSNHAYPPYKR